MPKILVVDDEEEVLQVTVSMIRKHGYTVDSAVNGADALKKIRIDQPDLILTDVLMPEMDGYKFYKELKNDPATAEIPVLVITGRGQMKDSFQVAGVDGFITKPFTTEDLFIEIENIFAVRINRARLMAKDGAHLRKKIIALTPDKTVLENMAVQSKRAGYYFEATLSSDTLVSQAMKTRPDVLFIDIGCKDMARRNSLIL